MWQNVKINRQVSVLGPLLEMALLMTLGIKESNDSFILFLHFQYHKPLVISRGEVIAGTDEKESIVYADIGEHNGI